MTHVDTDRYPHFVNPRDWVDASMRWIYVSGSSQTLNELIPRSEWKVSPAGFYLTDKAYRRVQMLLSPHYVALIKVHLIQNR